MGTVVAIRARWAITAVFGGNGLIIASMAVRTPSLMLDLGLSAGQLGLVSALFGISAVTAMQTTGGLSARVGSAWLVRLTILLLPVLLLGVGLVPGFAALAALMLVFGAVHGTLDVTMNAHAVAVERALGRHILNGCHAAWSIGAVAGSLLGSGAAQLGLSRPVHYAVLAALLVPLAGICGRMLLPAAADRRSATAVRGAPTRPARTGWRAGWTRPVLLFGAMGATVLTVEAAVANWSGVFLHDHLSAPLGLAALGYVAFTGCQTAGRLVGDRLLARASAARMVRVGTIAAAAGLAVVVLSPSAGLAVAGFALLGLGLATPLPVLFGVVGHLGAERADAEAGGAEVGGGGAAASLARFSTMTYAGILLAPAVIGWFTELVGLTWTLAALIPLLSGVACLAGVVIRPTAPSAPEPAEASAAGAAGAVVAGEADLAPAGAGRP
jgi:MFS family permease